MCIRDRDNYAAATFEETKDRIVQLGWMNCWAYAQKVPEEGFRGSMTIPRELFLLETPNGTRMGQKPAREIFDNIHIQRLTENKVVQDVLNGIFEIEPQGDRGEIFIKNEYETLSVSFDYKKGWSAGFTEIGVKRDWLWRPNGYHDEVMLQKIFD